MGIQSTHPHAAGSVLGHSSSGTIFRRTGAAIASLLCSLLTVKRVILGSLAVLALLTVGMLGLDASSSWSAYSRTADQREFDTAANRMVKGIYEILLERLATNNALQAELPAAPAATGEIESHRNAVRELFDTGLADVERHEFPNRHALLEDLKAKLQRANDYRRQADAALRFPRAQRSEELRKSFVPALTEAVNAALRVWYAVLYSTAGGDSELEKLASIKEIGWKMRELSGIERANVAAAIAADVPLPGDRLAAAADLRSRVDALFAVLQNLTQDPNTHPAIIEAMRRAQTLYFKEFLTLSDAMRTAGEGRSYPITATQWVERTNPQIDSLLAIMQAASTASEEHMAADMAHSYRNFIDELAALLAGILVVLLAACGMFAQVTHPLARLSAAMRELAAGNFDVVLPGLGRSDEIGAVARAVEAFKVKATEKATLEANERAQAARAAAERRRADMNRLADEFQAAAGGIVNTVSSASTQLEAAANTLTKSAAATRELSGVVASASEEASANVQSVASATEEITASVKEISRQVLASGTIAAQAVKQAERTDARITELSQAAVRIGDVVKLITAIAEQTNLLALNATIEAARAGEAGRGFAVVASEVKALAAQTAKATEEIGKQVASIQAATNESVTAIKEIGGTIGKISEIASTIVATVEEQAAATEEIARNVQRAAHGTSQVAENIADVNRGAGETGLASTQVLAAAESLARESDHLKHEVEKFLSTVRAA